MPNLVADTWDISGGDFIAAFLGALAVFVVFAVVIRLSVTRSGDAGSTRQPTPGEIALLMGGPSQAMYASLAGLRACGAVGLGALGALTVTGPAPTELSRLDHAVYDAASRKVRVANLQTDHRVHSALTELTDSVARSGWLLDPSARSRARLGGWLLLALGVFGIVRIGAGIANGKDVAYLVLLTALAIIVGLIVMRVPRRSAGGARAIAETRRANAYLAPSQSPAWATYGFSGAAMGVALFGTSALWAADPAFAGEAGIRRTATSGDAGSSGWSGDSGDSSGGGSCSGGGGCGGGGCGGGGCGG